MILRSILQKVLLLIAAGLLAGCGLTVDPPVVEEIQSEPSNTKIHTGEEVTLRINAQGTDIEYEWSADKGDLLSDPARASVIYKAPDSPGRAIVTVKISSRGGDTEKAIIFDVEEPPPPPVATATETPLPVATQTPTSAPEPIACNHVSVTKNLFPQLEKVEGQSPTYGPVGEDPMAQYFLCQAVYDPVHTPGKLAVHIKYENVGTNFGWWGVATPNGYDASGHSQVCFWAYVLEPNQSFRMKMKDTSKREQGVVTTVETANQWKQICTNISAFQELGVNTQQMDNVNLGFEAPLGSAEIWIADFEFQ